MYCKYCGKYTENLNCICNDCVGKSPYATGVTMANTSEQPVINNEYTSKYGRSNAIRAFVFSLVSTFLAGVAYGLVLVALALIEEYVDKAEIKSMLSTGFIFIIPALVFSILGLIKGIKSIKNFKEAKANGATPVPTLVFGIIALVEAAAAILITILSVFFIIICFGALAL
ncbi:MAG: hypothetical protein IJW13_03905 [Clostridia bacterium]|nr:hypothetical protein [Clostridia bacterium]